MQHSKRSHEGYLLVDNSNGPGVSATQLRELERRAGKKADISVPCGEGERVEAPVLACSHCEAAILVNPMRTRDRPHCRKCDHYICDRCDLIRKLGDDTCKHRFRERAAERAAHGLPISHPQQRVTAGGVILP